MAVGEKAACRPCRRWRCPGPHLDRWQISSDQGQRDSRRMEEVPWGKLFDLDPGGRKLDIPSKSKRKEFWNVLDPVQMKRQQTWRAAG